MDASEITKLLQKQHTRILHRPQTVDASTLTWQQQLRSSTYIHPPHQTTPAGCCDPEGQRQFGGQSRQTTLQTGSTQHVLSPMAPATGSASQVYSSDALLLQRAGRHACAVPALGPIELPQCECVPSNVTDQPNGQPNPYLPPFDTYYALKNPCFPTVDQNAKHFVGPCCP
jgi:hypothetical protein